MHNQKLVERFYIIENEFPGALFCKSLDGIYLACNSAFYDLLKIDVIGKSDIELWPSCANLICNNDKKVIDLQKIESFEEIILVNNSQRWVLQVTKKPVIDNQMVIGIMGSVADITHYNKQYVLFNNFPGCLYWKDKEGRYLGCNEYMIFDTPTFASSSDLIGKTDYDLFPKEQADKLRAADYQVMQTGQAIIIEETITLSDGQVRTYLAIKHPLKQKDGDIIGIIGNSVDMTAFKNLQLQLQKAKEKAESACQEIEAINAGIHLLAGSIAHELRTPLSTISSAMTGILKHLPILIDVYQRTRNNDSKVPYIPSYRLEILKDLSQKIQQEVSFSHLIINMMLTKIRQSDVIGQELQLCSIKNCIMNTLERYPLTCEEKRLIHFDDSYDFYFKGNELLVVHIIFNLLKNAFYYIKAASKGEIYINLEAHATNNKVYFKDTSKGIASEDLPYIFERFYSKTLGGAGIGLAFCKQVMHEIGGDISCDSLVNEFTLFTLTFTK